MTTPSMRNWAVNGLRVALLAAVIAHFALTSVYVVYTNPLSRILAPVLDSYTDKYFGQGWMLFAPNPLAENLSLMVRPLTGAEAAAAKTGSIPTSGWYDLTRGLWERRQRMPFSSDEALGHFHVVMIQNYFDGDPAGFSSYYACREDTPAACDKMKAALIRDRERAVLTLWRLGSGFVNSRFSTSAYPAMALKIHEEFAAPWRDRGTGRRRTSRDILMGVYATDAARAPIPAPAVRVGP
ncbi:MAG TPA: DUF5819 family protein [bacterium]|nr:DUF5819 family protein [bacterium]